MGLFEMVVLVTFIATVGKVAEALLSRAGGSSSGAGRERVDALEAELRASNSRLAQAEEKVAELSEKVEFMENLLAGPRPAPRLTEPASGPES
jgi:hypothetical protein